MERMADLIARYAQPGQVAWIGLRPARRGVMQALSRVAITEAGLAGDHGRAGKRAVTLIQAEHLAVIGGFLGRGPVAPEALRRNLVVSGLNLLGLRGRVVRVGGALLEVTGPCAPCSRMEAAFGPGGYAAVRGHGGMTARVLQPGEVALGDTVQPND
ncbi:MOSC domain-containing protein [Marinovum sp.]|uniref:MOSC domain-containing protein n=1 Tax=Marinovum sp. TaxID=2024839 RepID=UPI002B26534B|nr:MOSC domain-containing protein [Marinovum sp.]